MAKESHRHDHLTRIRLAELQVDIKHFNPEDETAGLRWSLRQHYGIHPPAAVRIVRRAFDARGRQLMFKYIVELSVPEYQAKTLLAQNKATAIVCEDLVRYEFAPGHQKPARPIVVGAGPAGLFAALTLAEAGLAPIIIERGKDVKQRAKDVSKLYAHGILNSESNVCYGEGGAGTFSDGKLYSRRNDKRILFLLETMVRLGAPQAILAINRPHLGTDKLFVLLQALRAYLESLGTVFRFNTRLEDLQCKTMHGDKHLTGIVLQNGETIDCQQAILATGHSAKDVWTMLHQHQIPLECRPFAMGFRIEHPQPLINEARYGKNAPDFLPAADYSLTYQNPHAPMNPAASQRGVYSFCMCPGGVVVTTPTEANHLCINGMSHASRSGRFANSAIVVNVVASDYAQAGFQGTFAGVLFQEFFEKRAYEKGGGSFQAPACRVSDFIQQKSSSSLATSSYRRGLNPESLHDFYPEPLSQAIQEALLSFHKKLPGFVSEEASLIAIESRTASPIRLPRDLQGVAKGLQGLYPAGEGMGYGGGIVSAAIDGIKAAEALLIQAGAKTINDDRQRALWQLELL